jgi:hypothetical protein
MGPKIGRSEPGAGSKMVEHLSVRICGIPFLTGISRFFVMFFFNIGWACWACFFLRRCWAYWATKAHA